VVEKDLDPDADQDETAGDFGGLTELRANPLTYSHACESEQERNCTDQEHGLRDADVDEGQADADGERVDAGGD